MENIEAWSVVLVSGVLGAATAIQGVAGFGFMLLGLVGLIQVYAPQIAVPALIVVYIPVGIAQTIQLRRDVDLRLLATWVAGAVVGVVPGTLVLTVIDPITLKRFIGFMTIVLTVAVRFNPGEPFRRDTLARLFAGLAGGVTGGATAAAGPPIVLMSLKQQWPVESFRATLFLLLSHHCLHPGLRPGEPQPDHALHVSTCAVRCPGNRGWVPFGDRRTRQNQ